MPKQCFWGMTLHPSATIRLVQYAAIFQAWSPNKAWKSSPGAARANSCSSWAISSASSASADSRQTLSPHWPALRVWTRLRNSSTMKGYRKWVHIWYNFVNWINEYIFRPSRISPRFGLRSPNRLHRWLRDFSTCQLSLTVHRESKFDSLIKYINIFS